MIYLDRKYTTDGHDPRVEIIAVGTESTVTPVDLEHTGETKYHTCTIVHQATTFGKPGLTSDTFLHWAHVAIALALSTEDATARDAYMTAARYLGKYAANALVSGNEVVAHEYGHLRLLQRGVTGHLAADCCMCGITWAWIHGVRGWLGLPQGSVWGSEVRVDGVDTGTASTALLDPLTRYPEWISATTDCGTDSGVLNDFSYVSRIAQPGARLSSMTFTGWGCHADTTDEERFGIPDVRTGGSVDPSRPFISTGSPLSEDLC